VNTKNSFGMSTLWLLSYTLLNTISQLSPGHSSGVSGIRDRTTSYDAGTALSRNSTLLLTTPEASHCPRSWINPYYPILNTGLDRSLEKLDNGDVPIWSAGLVEDGDPRDEYAHKYGSTISTQDGLSFDGDVCSSPPLVLHQGEI
jgi:hypothetical protein